MEYRLEWIRLVDELGYCVDFYLSGIVVVIGMYLGRWFVLDVEIRDLVFIYIDGNEQFFVMCYLIDGIFLVVGFYDNFIYFYVVFENGRKYSRYGRCIGYFSYIIYFDWFLDNKYIMFNLGDYEILYWDILNGCKLIRN